MFLNIMIHLNQNSAVSELLTCLSGIIYLLRLIVNTVVLQKYKLNEILDLELNIELQFIIILFLFLQVIKC